MQVLVQPCAWFVSCSIAAWQLALQAMLPKGGDTKSGKIALDATLRNARARTAWAQIEMEPLSEAFSTDSVPAKTTDILRQ